MGERADLSLDRRRGALLGLAVGDALGAAVEFKAPSEALANAMLAHWPEHLGEVANAMLEWRLRRAAPVFAKSLMDSADGDVRAYAAMALGGTGDRAYLDLLRRVSSSDRYPLARALAYDGIMHGIGPEALADLRLGARDSHENVRAQAVVDAYNMLELESEDRRFSPAASALVDDVVAFLTATQSDPARLVSDNAKSMLAYIARHRKYSTLTLRRRGQAGSGGCGRGCVTEDPSSDVLSLPSFDSRSSEADYRRSLEANSPTAARCGR